jgi:elongation factor P
MALTDTFVKGMFLIYEDKIHFVVDRKYKTQGRQGGLIILTMQNLETGNNLTVTIKAGVKLDRIDPSYKEMQYSYNEDTSYYFMDTETYEMLPLSESVIGDYSKYLKEGENYVIMFYDERAIYLRQNPTVELKVTESAPAVKGNTANSATKLVTTETGYKLNVPMFIETGDILLINTESGSYTKRL